MANAKNSVTGRRMTRRNTTAQADPTGRVRQTFVNRSQLFAAATALSAVGLLMVPTPARAGPMFPLAPACTQYGFTGGFSLRQNNGFQVSFPATGPTAAGKAVAVGDDNVTKLTGTVRGGIQGRTVYLKIGWAGGAIGVYSGTVGDDGFAHGSNHEDGVVFDGNSGPAPSRWDATSPLGCLDAPPPPVTPPGPGEKPGPAEKPIPPAGPATARLGVVVNGPTTRQVGLTGTYTVSVSNSGDVGAPVQLSITFGGQLQQTDQVTPSGGGFNCEVFNNAGGKSAVRCTTQELQSKETVSIAVQARGSAPGPGDVLAKINSSDAGAQFVEMFGGVHVKIT